MHPLDEQLKQAIERDDLRDWRRERLLADGKQTSAPIVEVLLQGDASEEQASPMIAGPDAGVMER